MPDRTKSAGFPAIAIVIAALASLFLIAIPAAASASSAQISIVNGQKTSITKSPWQVAITAKQRLAKPYKPRARFFCGGSLIAPDLVITAGHCVADLKPRQVRRIEIISGRTRLNDESRGSVTGVKDLIMPTKPDGQRRYTDRYGAANWDVALLRLDSAVPGATPIKLAGEDETDFWTAGALVTTTGWGVTGAANRKASAVLRTTKQVMLADGVCRRYDGRAYQASTMNCLGGPSGNSTTCFGDSGGPLVVSADGEPRLIGLTSFGDADCRANIPSIDSRIAGDPMRSWIQEKALDLSGVDVIGTGGIAPPKRAWCEVPRIYGLSVGRARIAVQSRGCRVAGVLKESIPGLASGRVTGSSFVTGWLVPLGTGVNIWVNR